MKEIIKRVIFVIVFFAILITILGTVASCSIRKGYKYLTFENEWGYSDKCYQDEEQRLICVVNNEILSVRQYEVIKN